MLDAGEIYYKRRHEIDVAKWDQCINKASNGLIYAYSLYLDHMADNWDALIMGDYVAVMPLPWRKKFAIQYLYQPFLTPQLGVIGNAITPNLLHRFIVSIPRKFSFVEINLNSGNFFKDSTLPLQKKVNYLLTLNLPYDKISKRYNQNLKRNIKKAFLSDCHYEENAPFEEVFQQAIKQFGQHSNFSKIDVTKFRDLTIRLLREEKAQSIGVYQKDLLQACCIFLVGTKTINYILASSTPHGRKIGASHFLLDQFIKNNAGNDIILDFVGSDIPSVALFYESFGATSSIYASLRINRLPTLFRWIKS